MLIEESKILKRILKECLKFDTLENQFEIFEINNNIPFTFNNEDYEVKEGIPRYTDSNKLGKSGSATAIISKNTLAIYTSEHIEYPNPINWEKLKQQKKVLKNGEERSIFQRCHIIGYHLSARFSNPHNIFIGTDTLNHGAMKDIEDDIYKEVFENNRIFLYKVTPIYMFIMEVV